MIIFRADGNKIIGSGHVMRCVAIAEALRILHIESLFVLAENTFVKVLEEHHFKYEILQSDYCDMESEIESFRELLDIYFPEAIIIDSYYVTFHYLESIKQYGKVIYIDDRAEFAYPVDILVNYNIFAKETEYKNLYKSSKMTIPTLLLGAKYVPLRKEFQNTQKNILKEEVFKILISTGGADSEHVMLNIVKYLEKHSIFGNYEFHFVIGAMNGDKDEICKRTKDMKNIVLHQNVESMQRLIHNCDIAVSAAGTTLYELCACGIPTITYILADNQIVAEKIFAEREIMLSAGDIRTKSDFLEELFQLLNKLSNDYALRIKLVKNAYQAVNANGVNILARKILEEITMEE